MTTDPTTSPPATAVPAAAVPATAGSLAAVPRLLRSDPVLAALIGAADATVAVPEAAQSVVAAALAAFTERTPLLVITATGLDAERLGDDLSCLIAAEDDRAEDLESGGVVGALSGAVTVLPAWETLPFERVSPETETMGRRLAVLHALTASPDPILPAPPRVIVAPVRAILQRLGPLSGTAPIVIRPGQQVDVAELLPQLVAMGYRREHQVEHRGEFAVRGGIVDVFPSTADAPVRIDLWGDEVDRLTAFSVSDQRSSQDLRAVALYGCRELVRHPGAARRRVGARDAASLGRIGLGEPGRGRAVRRHGVVAPVPRRHGAGPARPPARGSTGRAGGAAPDQGPRGAAARRGGGAGRDAGGHLGGEGGGRGELPAPARALRAPAARQRGRRDRPAARPRRPRHGRAHGAPLRPGGGGPGPPGRRCDGTRGPGVLGHPVRRHGGGGGAAVRRPGRRGRARARARRRTGHGGGLRGGGAPHQRVHPARDQGRRALRDRRHRPAGPAPQSPPPGAGRRRLLRRPRGRELRGAPPARRGALRGRDDEDHGGDHPRLPDPAVPGVGPPLPAGRADRGHHPLQRRRVPDALEDGRLRLAEDPGQGPCRGQRGGGGAGRALPPAPGRRGQGVRPRHAVADRDGGILRVRRDRGPTQGDRRREGRHGGAAADGPPGVRRCGLRQDRGRRAGRLQGGPGGDAGRHFGPDHAAGQPARADLRRPLRAVSGAGGAAEPVPVTGPAAPGRAGTGRRQRRRRGRHPPPAGPGRAVQGPRPAGGRRGAALRGDATRRPSSACPRASTC